MNSVTCPDSLDEDSVEVEPKGVGVSDGQTGSRVAGLEIYTLTFLTVQR